jgi:hypothetical protein
LPFSPRIFNINIAIFFLVAGILQLFWIIPMLKKWGRIWYAIGIAGTVILIGIWAVTRIPDNPITGEVICISCGAVISDKIAETRPEWSVYGTNKLNSRSRVGMPISLAIHDVGLSMVIGKSNKDFSGKTIVDESMRVVIERTRTWDYRTQTRSSKGQRLQLS